MQNKISGGKSFLITIAILLFGIFVEYIIPFQLINNFTFPSTLFLGLILINLIIISYFLFRNYLFVKWLVSIPAAIGSISLLIFLGLLMGFIPQNENFNSFLGINNIINTWYFSFTILYLLFSLGFVTIKRIIPFSIQNIGFILNHLGLWIIIFIATVSSNDIKRLNVVIHKNQIQNIGTYNNSEYELPCSFELQNFDIEFYNPKLQIRDIKNNRVIISNISIIKDDSFILETDSLKIKIKDLLPNAVPGIDSFVKSDYKDNIYAIKLEVISIDDTIKGWLSTQSRLFRSAKLIIDDKYELSLSKQEAKKYQSKVIVRTINQDIDTVSIEVNKPYNYRSWNFYQLSYDEKAGKWSEYTVLEAVYDPWISILYFGIFMLLAGCIYIIWMGNKKTSASIDKN